MSSSDSNPTLINSETILDIAQAQRLEAKSILTNWKVHDLSRARLEADRQRVAQDWENLQKKEQELKTFEEEVKSQRKTNEKTWEEATEAQEKAKTLNEETKLLADKNAANAKDLLSLSQQAEEVSKRLTQANLKEEETKKALADVQAETKQADQIRTEICSIRDSLSKMHNHFWPACLTGDDWSQWQQQTLAESFTNARAALLVSAFAYFTAAERSGDLDEVGKALREVGRRLYIYTKDHQRAHKVGEAFNQAGSGRFSLKVPNKGEPTNTQLMNFQPGVATVQDVQNWTVYIVGPNGVPLLKTKADVL